MVAASALFIRCLSAFSSDQLVPRDSEVLLVRLQSSSSCQVAAWDSGPAAARATPRARAVAEGAPDTVALG